MSWAFGGGEVRTLVAPESAEAVLFLRGQIIKTKKVAGSNPPPLLVSSLSCFTRMRLVKSRFYFFVTAV